MEQTYCSFESENSNSVTEVKAQRLRRKTLSQFKEEKLRVGKCAGICTSSCWEKTDMWRDILEASFSSPHSCPGSSNPPGNWDLPACAVPLPQSLLNWMSGSAWLTLCNHNFLSAAFASFTWKALTNYKNWKKNWFTVTGCVLHDQSRVSHSRFGCDITQLHTEKDEPLTPTSDRSRSNLWLWDHLMSIWHSCCRDPQSHPPFL